VISHIGVASFNGKVFQTEYIESGAHWSLPPKNYHEVIISDLESECVPSYDEFQNTFEEMHIEALENLALKIE